MLLSEPLKWGMRLTVMDLDLVQERRPLEGRRSATPTLLNANTVPEDPTVAALLRAATTSVVRPTSTRVIGTCKSAMSAATARFEDTAAIDFINYVQADAVKKALAGTPTRPCRCCRSPRRSTGTPPSRPATSRCATSPGLYIFDNTLLGIRLTGAAGARPTWSTRRSYFKQVTAPARSPPTR